MIYSDCSFNGNKKKMTIYDIAKEANVAACTVSRVINKKEGVSCKTREKVEKILCRMARRLK